MTIREVVEKAISIGCLNPSLSALLLRALEDSYLKDPDEILALQKLMEAVRDGSVVTIERKRCFNIMEDLVWEALEAQYATLKLKGGPLPDIGDVAAYALNHLKPLYAVSEVGADYQRNKARLDHAEIVAKRVREALEFSLGRPVWHPERKTIAPNVTSPNVLNVLEKTIKNPLKK